MPESHFDGPAANALPPTNNASAAPITIARICLTSVCEPEGSSRADYVRGGDASSSVFCNYILRGARRVGIEWAGDSVCSWNAAHRPELHAHGPRRDAAIAVERDS